ncbi:MAG TPA: ferritin [Bacteroidia bacterium]|jgi:ferritin|nr:ferritin [Bacteroidia bacterium]
MNRNRLSITLQTALNDQMTREASASQLYLSFGAWAHRQGFEGIGSFLFRHAEEERDHMTKLMEYILTRGGEALIVAIPAPPAHPTTINNCFEMVFSHEVENTRAIYKLVKMSLTEEDWATWNFLQWFVQEQVEEETLAGHLLDKLKIAGGDKALGDTLYLLDRELNSSSGTIEPAESVTAAKP